MTNSHPDPVQYEIINFVLMSGLQIGGQGVSMKLKKQFGGWGTLHPNDQCMEFQKNEKINLRKYEIKKGFGVFPDII